MGAVLMAGVAQASPISIYTAPDKTYQNGGNNPCLFAGSGGGGCNSSTLPFPAWTEDTGGNDPFTPNPLTNTIGDAAGELLQFGTAVGRDFFLGFDVNDTSDAQTLSNVTITFRDVNGNVLGSGYQFAPAIATPSNKNGSGYADYILSAGCLGVVGGGSGILATCSNYAPFVAPAGVRSIQFTFGLTGANDGADKLFAIPGPEALKNSKALAAREGIFVGITAGATLTGALKIAADAEKGSTILCMLPDTGERYLSTPLFADIAADMNDEELAISQSTPSAPLPPK
jgi:hypothetical protein